MGLSLKCGPNRCCSLFNRLVKLCFLDNESLKLWKCRMRSYCSFLFIYFIFYVRPTFFLVWG